MNHGGTSTRISNYLKKATEDYMIIKKNRLGGLSVLFKKIFFTFIREKIEVHLETWGIRYEEQYGFTEGGRIEQCLFTVNYITNRTFEGKKAKHKYLYLAMIDFSKAYDSVDRKKLIETIRLTYIFLYILGSGFEAPNGFYSLSVRFRYIPWNFL